MNACCLVAMEALLLRQLESGIHYWISGKDMGWCALITFPIKLNIMRTVVCAEHDTGQDAGRSYKISTILLTTSVSLHSRPQKLRWPSFQNSHRPSSASAPLQIGCQSVLQMNLLQKLSLLQLTALLEKHTPTNKHGFSW